MEFGARIRHTGPVLSGRGAGRLMAELEREIEREVAQETERMIHTHLGKVLRRPTGYYQSQIGIRGAPGGLQVSDNNVVYGPWLEGTGSMNFPATRFKGYSTFRRVTQIMDRQSQRVAARITDRFIDRRLT